MPNDKSKRGEADRWQVAAGSDYEVTRFARRHGITRSQAIRIIKDAGADRAKADRLAKERYGS